MEVAGYLKENPLIVYEWSPDGLFAAILILAYAAEEHAGVVAVEEATPTASVIERVAVESRRAESVVLLGSGWCGAEVDLLASSILAPLVAVDHVWAAGEPRRPNVVYYNPSERGDSAAMYPGVAGTVSRILGHPHPLLAAAGIVYLMGETAKSNRVYQNLMVSAGLDHLSDYGLAYECMMQGYGVTSMGDPAAYGSVPLSVVEVGGDPCKAMLRDTLLTWMRGTAEAALEESRSEARVREEGDVILVEAEGDGRHWYRLSQSFALEYNGRQLITLYREKASGERVGCAWHTAGDRPLARILHLMRKKGYRGVGSHHGPLNYACFKSVTSSARFIDDLKAALGEA